VAKKEKFIYNINNSKLTRPALRLDHIIRFVMDSDDDVPQVIFYLYPTSLTVV